MDVAGGNFVARGQGGGRPARPVFTVGGDDADLGYVPCHGGDGADGLGIAHQDGIDEAGVGSLTCAFHDHRVAGPGYGHGDCRQALAEFQKIGRNFERRLAEHCQ